MISGFEGDEIKEELLNLVKDVQSCSQQSLESNFTAASSVPSVDSCLDELSSDVSRKSSFIITFNSNNRKSAPKRSLGTSG